MFEMKLVPDVTKISTGGNRDILLPEMDTPEALDDQNSAFGEADLEFKSGIEDTHDPVRT